MTVETDFLIIGSGIAGLSFALEVAEHGEVALVTKKAVMDSNTNLAQGGIASVFDPLDSFDLHIQDTLLAGDGLCNRDVVDLVVTRGPESIRRLIDMGVDFNLNRSPHAGSDLNEFDLGREGGHSRNRIVHAQDMTGRAVERVLVERVRSHGRISLYENHIAIDLITCSTRMKRGQVTTTHEDYCCGAYVLDRMTQRVETFRSKITLLAPVAPVKSTFIPATRTSQPVMASPWATGRGPPLPTSSSSSFIRRACSTRMPKTSSFRKPSGVRGRTSMTRHAGAVP